MANYTSVVASNICDAAGNKLANGTVSFQATDAANQPMNFQVGGGGQVVTTPATAAITAGVVAGGFQVADSASTSPAGVLYRITVTDNTLNRVVVTYSLVTVTGASFNLDTYTPTAASVLPPTGGSVNGPLTVTGNLSVTGSFNPGTLGNITSTGAILAKNIEGVRYAEQFSGSDIGAQINAAIADLGASGGKIKIAAGSYAFSTQIVVSGSGIAIEGDGGLTSGAQPAVKLTWTGTGNPVNAHASSGFHLTGVMLLWNNASFAAPVLDLTASAFAEIDHCYFGKAGGSSGAQASPIIALDTAIITSIHDNSFQNYAVAIKGQADSGISFANVINIVHNTFSTSTGSASGAAISNLGQSWTITNNTFEMGTAAGTPIVFGYANANCYGTGIGVRDNWIGDLPVAAAALTLLTIQGTGWTIESNLIGGNANSTGVSIANIGNQGIAVKNNTFLTHANGVVITSGGTAPSQIDIGPNSYNGVASPENGLTNAASLIDFNNNAFSVYGPIRVVQSSGGGSNVGLPPSTGSSLWIVSGGSPVLGRLYLGDGSGFQLNFSKRSGGVDTDLFQFLDSGKLGIGTAPTYQLDVIGTARVSSSLLSNGTSTFGGGTALSRYARYTPTISPASVAANTTAEQTFTGVLTAGDFVVGVSKPSAQAGLGIVGWRANGTSLCVTFSNNTGAPITPTASEVYQVVAVQ